MKPLPVRLELLAFVAATRPDLDQDVLNGALDQAARIGWTWKQAAYAVWQLLWDEDSTAWGLRDAVRDPLNRTAERGDERQGAEYARQLLNARRGAPAVGESLNGGQPE